MRFSATQRIGVCLAAGLIVACCAARAMADEEAREWADRSWQTQGYSDADAFDHGKVTLEKVDGKLLEIELGKLSAYGPAICPTHQGKPRQGRREPV